MLAFMKIFGVLAVIVGALCSIVCSAVSSSVVGLGFSVVVGCKQAAAMANRPIA